MTTAPTQRQTLRPITIAFTLTSCLVILAVSGFGVLAAEIRELVANASKCRREAHVCDDLGGLHVRMSTFRLFLNAKALTHILRERQPAVGDVPIYLA